MTEIITGAAAVVTAGAGWVGDFATQITSTPLLLVFAVLPLVGLGIGMLKRLLSK